MTNDTRSRTADPPDEFAAHQRGRIRLVGVLVLALAARLAVMGVWWDNLTDDRDGYLSLATGLAEGRGFSIPGTETPTAYRPPLYPLTLLPTAFLPSALWTAVLHTILGLATVWLTWVLAIRLTSPLGPMRDVTVIPMLAALFVAVDPILLRYASFPMTETLAAFLVTALLVALTPESTQADSLRPKWRSILVGILFGLVALCRPAIWGFGGLMGLWGIARWAQVKTKLGSQGGERTVTRQSRNDPRHAELIWWITLMATAAVLLHWVVRNTFVLGHPVVMTTHGGYTLLLGNNPAFDREVVTQPWGTVWDGSRGAGQAEWAHQINRTMDAAGLNTEVARDRWMNERARDNIMADPAAFARACWLRFRRFWGVVPVDGASDQPNRLRWGVGLFYVLLFIGAVVGLFIIWRERLSHWGPSLLMVMVFMSVHLVYWTNTRMRAPIAPVIAILSAVGWSRLRKSKVT